MNNKNKLILLGVVGLTVLYYFWLTTWWWKLGFTLINTWFLLMIAGIFRKEVKSNRFWWTGWVSSLVLGGFLTLRSNYFVSALNVMVVMLLNLLLTCLAKETEAKFSFDRVFETLLRYIGNWIRALISGASGIIGLAPKKVSGWRKVLAGAVISLPLLLIFGALFYSADPIFARFINQIKLPEINLEKILNFRSISTLLFLAATWAAIQQRLADERNNFRPAKHINEIQIAAMFLQGLFLIFSLIQIRYFWVTTEDLRQLGITFSQYTRQGYTQMIISCLLAWLVVYGLDYLMRSHKETGEGHFKLTRNLSLAFMGEILLFIAAATKRNWLYQSAYGFTQIRILGFWLSLWLVAIVVMTFIKIIKERNLDFLVRKMILTTLITLIGLNLFNIDRTIAVTRPAKLAQGVDYQYIVSLSNDASDGWDELLNDVERRINNNEITSYIEVERLRSMLSLFSYKETELNKQQAKNWNFLGSWNYSDMKAKAFFAKNKNRIVMLQSRLNKVSEEIYAKELLDLSRKADDYRGIIREILLSYRNVEIDDRASWNIKQKGTNSMAVFEVGVEDDAKISEIRQKIKDRTNGRCNVIVTGSITRNNRKLELSRIECFFD